MTLGIDIGTTSVSGVAVDDCGKVAATVTHVGSVASCPRPVRSDQAVAAASCDRTPPASVLSTPSYCSTRPFVT